MIIDSSLGVQNVTMTNSYHTNPTDATDELNDWKHILPYAVPVGCAIVAVFVLLLIGVSRRQKVLEKWSSLKRMKNTRPKNVEETVLRRNSEYEPSNHGFINPLVVGETSNAAQQTEIHLSTIS